METSARVPFIKQVVLYKKIVYKKHEAHYCINIDVRIVVVVRIVL